MTGLVGRDDEIATVLGVLGRPGPAAATIVAPPGLGKTTIFQAVRRGVDVADAVVLAAAPLEVEAAMPFSGLGDLLGEIPDAMLGQLPPAQCHALRSALLLEGSGDGVDPRAVALGLRGVLLALAARGPLLLMIDDAQWIDEATARALAQAMRRIGGVDARVLAAMRPVGRQVETWLPSWPRTELRLSGLGADEIFEVVRMQTGIVLERSSLRKVMQACAGNPLHALEYARHASGDRGFSELLGHRLLDLPRATRLGLLTAALAGSADLDLVACAMLMKPENLVAQLEPAVAAGFVRLTSRVEFQHPVYLEAAVEVASTVDVRAVHGQLANVESDPVRRVRHAAQTVQGQDPALADALDAAAGDEWARGAWDGAADLLVLAVDRTPDPAARAERMMRLGRWLITLGSAARALPWLRQARCLGESGPVYWEASVELACALKLLGRTDELTPLIETINLADLSRTDRARAVILLEFDWMRGRPDSPVESLREANRHLAGEPEAPGLARLRAMGLALEARLRAYAGEPVGELLAQARELEQREAPVRMLDSAALVEAHTLMNAERLPEARAVFEEILLWCELSGDDASIPNVCCQFSWLERRAGNWDRALALLDRARGSADAQGQYYGWLVDAGVAMIIGMREEKDRALGLLRPLVPDCTDERNGVFASIAWHLIGEIHLAHGEFVEAYTALDTALRCADGAGWVDPGDLHADADFVEAAIALGDLDAAANRIAIAEGRARHAGREGVLVECERLGVQLLAARGELDRAVDALPSVVAAAEEGPCQPFELARTYLAAGRIYRRARQKRNAQDQLQRALAIFEQLGCTPYVDQARRDLARVVPQQRAADDLTLGERQMAQLAADGLRNREIADRLFVSQKTVEATLARAYRKLGIRSRVELERAMSSTE